MPEVELPWVGFSSAMARSEPPVGFVVDDIGVEQPINAAPLRKAAAIEHENRDAFMMSP
jgi:hypothetical protein